MLAGWITLETRDFLSYPGSQNQTAREPSERASESSLTLIWQLQLEQVIFQDSGSKEMFHLISAYQVV